MTNFQKQPTPLLNVSYEPLLLLTPSLCDGEIWHRPVSCCKSFRRRNSQKHIIICRRDSSKRKIFPAIFFSTEEKNTQYRLIPSIIPVGTKDNESLFSYNSTVYKGFRLLQKYFPLSDKFYGFDIKLPGNFDVTGENFIYIPLPESGYLHADIGKNFLHPQFQR